jgi:hypothetical protein
MDEQNNEMCKMNEWKEGSQKIFWRIDNIWEGWE